MTSVVPEISVCIPVYNGATYLRETLESVVSQEGVRLEIVVGDDGSSDDSMVIARSYAQNHTQHDWKLLAPSLRLGMTANWNACLKAASGEFVKVMGQDDLLYKGCLNRQAVLLRDHPKISLVVSGCEIISARGKILFKRPRQRKEGVYPGLEMARECLVKRANLIGEPVTVLARRNDYSLLGGFSDNHRYYIDLEMWLRLLELGDCGIIEEAQCAFRIHGRAVSFNSQRRDFDQFEKLPGAHDIVAMLSPLQQQLRLLSALTSTTLRSLVYSIFG